MVMSKTGCESDVKTPAVSVVICVIDPHPRYFLEAVDSILHNNEGWLH